MDVVAGRLDLCLFVYELFCLLLIEYVKINTMLTSSALKTLAQLFIMEKKATSTTDKYSTCLLLVLSDAVYLLKLRSALFYFYEFYHK